MLQSKHLFVPIIVCALLLGGISVVSATSSDSSASQVSEIKLSVNGTKLNWVTTGYSKLGYKIVWSLKEWPTYPLRDSDRYVYLDDGNASSYTGLTPFNGSGEYYVRVCEYLGGKCGAYSNQVTMQLNIEEKKCAKEGEKTSGAVSPEYHFGCCEGLKDFYPYKNMVGAKSVCYDPAKGEPVCKYPDSAKAGWYYEKAGTLIFNADCSADNWACTMQYDPVCGADGKTYSNSCIAEKSGKTKVKYQGECRVCKISCLRADPVCGMDGKTYTCGTAELDCQGIKLKYKGACGKLDNDSFAGKFRQIYGRNPNTSNKQDAWCLAIMKYGLKAGSFERNLESEINALRRFAKSFGYLPNGDNDWRVIWAIAYSGVK